MLGVPPSSNDTEIRAAYKFLAATWHPDRHQGDSQAAAQRKFQEIAEAFQLLSDAAARGEYDATLTAAADAEARRKAAQRYRATSWNTPVVNMQVSLDAPPLRSAINYTLLGVLKMRTGRSVWYKFGPHTPAPPYLYTLSRYLADRGLACIETLPQQICVCTQERMRNAKREEPGSARGMVAGACLFVTLNFVLVFRLLAG